MHDVVIRGGTVVDGTGAPARTADVAVDDGVITAVGPVDEQGRRELDADGLLVTPGWVDIHTHYDGQVTWDPEVTPSSWHGVTTVVMGNCGVGFAPVRSGAESFLIELMEGVEDIPGTALHEGIDWAWSSFPEYLDALDAMPRAIDVAAQVPPTARRWRPPTATTTTAFPSSPRWRAGPPACCSGSRAACIPSSPIPRIAPSPTCPSTSGWRGCAGPTCGPRCSPRSRRRAARWRASSCRAGARSSPWAIPPTTNRRPRGRCRPRLTARGAGPRRSSSTGSSSATGGRFSLPR